jgi:peroxiredoxin
MKPARWYLILIAIASLLLIGAALLFTPHWKSETGLKEPPPVTQIAQAALAIPASAPDEANTPTPIPTARPHFYYGSRKIPAVVPAEVNFTAPALSLSALGGDPISLSDLRGKMVLVNLWATWCPFCEAEMPEFEAYYQAHGGDDFTVVAIAIGDKDSEVQGFIQHINLTFPIWLDPKSESYRAFRNNHLPSSYVIDASGTVRFAWNGPTSYGMLEQYLTPLLQK